MPEVPGFHHLHLNTLDPEPAIDYYTKRFPTTTRTTWGGQPALMSPNNVLVLFEKVSQRPLTAPEAPDTAYWHFGWHVLDTPQTRDRFQANNVDFLPLYTGDNGGTVLISSDTWPGANGLLGRTVEQIEEAKATGVQPTRVGGFGYIEGPDRAMIEYAGNQPKERFNHIHMWQEDPFCAQLWYQAHLNAPLMPGRSAEGIEQDTCAVVRGLELTYPALEPRGMYRTPSAAVEFGDVAFMWYMRQGDQPLAPTRGQVYDHTALSVRDLDYWLTKLRGEGVRILGEPYKLGDTRAFMIEGPSLEAIELVQV